MVELMPHQEEAIKKLAPGKILYGGVGTGKTMTALAYYTEYEDSAQDLVVITTAKKRDLLDWEGEAAKFGISTNKETSCQGALLVDSWNNISKYEDLEGYFFIFDEQRLVGTGAWVKSFLKIAKNNRWILLSATPGDTWLDYAPVLIANGFYKNITEFKRRHVLYEAYSPYPKVKGYLDEGRLQVLRNDVLVEMPYLSHTERILNWIETDYDKDLYNVVFKKRWNPYDDQPIKNLAELFRLMRRVVNSDPSRLEMIRKLLTCHDRVIIFYSFNYELEILRRLNDEHDVYEWNGQRKDPIPDSERWVYLVQYVAGAEGWNCTSTNVVIFHSLTYSFKNFEQAQGRIDRLTTSYTSLYYYILSSNSEIDRAIRKSLESKSNFNERNWARKRGQTFKFGEVVSLEETLSAKYDDF